MTPSPNSLSVYMDETGGETLEDPTSPFFAVGGCAQLSRDYPLDKLAEDVGPGVRSRPGFSGITLAHNVRKKEEVAQVLALAAKSGGTVVKPAQDVFWGGHAGYFADPDGYYWEVAWGPEAKWDGAGHLLI